jgi:hypothetical protein
MTGRHDGPLALCLACLLFSVYLLTFSGTYHSSDEMSMLAVTDSLARRGVWDIELLRWMGEQQGSYGPDGHLYSRKGVGTSLAALPLYWPALQVERLGNVQVAMLTNGLVTALTGALLLLFLRRLGYGRGVALAVGLAFGLGTMAWPYARYLFSESLAGLGLVAAAYFLLRSRDEASLAGPLLAGAGLGVALLARLNNAIVAPFLGLLLLAYLYRRHGRDWQEYVTPVLLFGLPVLAALAVTGWYNALRFGSPLTTGYLPEERFSTPFFQGFYGLLLSPGRGLFWYNPLLFAAVAAWPAFLKRNRAEALLVAAVVLANVAFYAPWYLWWAGHAWGPRFLMTILPFAALPLAPAFQAAAHRRRLAAALASLALVSLAVQVLGVGVNFNLYLENVYAELGLYHPTTFFDPAYSPLLRQWAYLRAGNLDLAWAGGGTVDWPALLLGLSAVVLSVLALVAAWRGRGRAFVAGLPALLGLIAIGLLLRYAPTGDVALAAQALAAMERPGEAAVLTESNWTEALQDAYDGRLPLWGMPDPGQAAGQYDAIWRLGLGGSAPAPLRFQAGAVALAYHPAAGGPFDAGRLPAPAPQGPARLGGAVELAAADIEGDSLRPGQRLGVTLYWRALTPLEADYTMTVQVIDEGGTKAGQVDRQPCAGQCPTKGWRAGDLVGERFEVPIAADAAARRYRLIASIYDLATGQQLPAADGSTHLLLGEVQIRP